MKQNNTYISKFRNKKAEKRIYGMKGDLCNGIFSIPRNGYELTVIASNGGGWDHVSVSRPDETPSWDDMCEVKRLFFSDDETVVQFHPKSSEYINNHPWCLHLWKPQGEEIKLPPSIFVGINAATTPADEKIRNRFPDWCVVGAESGNNRRPCNIEWVRRIVQRYRENHIPVFVKQLEIDGKFVKDIEQFPEDLQIRQVPWCKRGENVIR